jgi:hypothetical protein
MSQEQHVKITVYCNQDHIVDTYLDAIAEKYPFHCPTCDDDLRDGKCRWYLKTEIVECE